MKIFEGTEKEYRDLEALSQSDLKTILKSPLHYKFRKELQRNTEAMNFGSAFHCAVLEPTRFKEDYVTAPTHLPNGNPINKRKKEDKQYLADFALSHFNKIVLDEDDIDSITGMLNSLASHELAQSLFTGGTSEVRALSEYRGHAIKGACDYLHESHIFFGPCLVELKSTQDASPESFVREMHNRLYDFQSAFYRLIFGTRRHITVAVENKFPYPVAVYDVEPFMDLGLSKVDRAFNRLQECLEVNKFGGYTSGVEQLLPTTWMVALESEVIE